MEYHDFFQSIHARIQNLERQEMNLRRPQFS